VVEREVDDAVGVRGRLPEPVEVSEVTPVDHGAERGYRRGGGVRPGQAGDLVSGGDQVRDDGRGEMAGRAGDENTHEGSLVYA